MKIYYVDITWDYGDGIENEVSRDFYENKNLSIQEFKTILDDTTNEWNKTYKDYNKDISNDYFCFYNENYENRIECCIIGKKECNLIRIIEKFLLNL